MENPFLHWSGGQGIDIHQLCVLVWFITRGYLMCESWTLNSPIVEIHCPWWLMLLKWVIYVHLNIWVCPSIQHTPLQCLLFRPSTRGLNHSNNTSPTTSWGGVFILRSNSMSGQLLFQLYLTLSQLQSILFLLFHLFNAFGAIFLVMFHTTTFPTSATGLNHISLFLFLFLLWCFFNIQD